jgi:hypothetical protein
MFNQLTPAEVVTAIGATVRSSARSEGEASAFERDQLMSAYSATRHLAVELAAFAPELHRFTQTVAGQARFAEAPAIREELNGLADRLDVATDAGTIGAAVCELFELLRRDGSPPARALRREVHVHLRSLADTEVDLLADALG